MIDGGIFGNSDYSIHLFECYKYIILLLTHDKFLKLKKEKCMRVYNIYSTYKNRAYNIYLYYLSYRFLKCKTAKDVILVFKNITFCYGFSNTDQLFDVITDCIKTYPIPTSKMQEFSKLQQKHESSHGIEEYATLIFWLCIIQSINEQPRMLCE